MNREIDDVLKERGSRYGEFPDHAYIAQLLKETIRMFPAFKRLRASQKEAIDMIAHKLARVLNGDPEYADNWTDIAGYARLVEQELVKEQDGQSIVTPSEE